MMLTQPAAGVQLCLSSYVKTPPSPLHSRGCNSGRAARERALLRVSESPDSPRGFHPAHSARPTITNAVYALLDADDALRWRVFDFDKDSLWSLTLRVGALMGKKVNPESVARTVRKYKNGR